MSFDDYDDGFSHLFSKLVVSEFEKVTAEVSDDR